MLKVCCCGISEKTGTKMVLLLAVFTALYQAAYFVLKPAPSIWLKLFTISTPLIDLIMAVIGLYGIRHGKAKCILPVASSRIIFVVICCIIIFLLPVATQIFTLEALVEELKKQFGFNYHEKENLPTIIEIFMMIFKSLLVYPMEEVLNESYTIIVFVYISYLVIITALQIYFVLVMFTCYKTIKHEEYRQSTLRYTIHPVPGNPDRPTYTLESGESTEPYVPSPREAFPSTYEEQHKVIVPNAKLATIN